MSATAGSGRAGTLYWRPGCPFCMRLRAGLHHAGAELDEVNIWEVPEAAARVRSITGGNETVPTVVIGGHELVNPPLRQVLDLLGIEAPPGVAARLLAHLRAPEREAD